MLNGDFSAMIDLTTGHLSLTCGRCQQEDNVPAGQNVVLAATAATFLAGHAQCLEASAAPDSSPVVRLSRP